MCILNLFSKFQAYFPNFNKNIFFIALAWKRNGFFYINAGADMSYVYRCPFIPVKYCLKAFSYQKSIKFCLLNSKNTNIWFYINIGTILFFTSVLFTFY